MCKIRATFDRFALVVTTMFMVQAALAAPQVTDVRVGVYSSKTRVVIEVSGALDFRSFTLPKPYRVVVDMSEVTWSPKLRTSPRGGLITGMRFGLFRPGLSRVVLDSEGPVGITKAFMIPPDSPERPHRIVLDIKR